ncbi:hypothetical protein D3C72_2031300 [compost metagenome]
MRSTIAIGIWSSCTSRFSPLSGMRRPSSNTWVYSLSRPRKRKSLFSPGGPPKYMPGIRRRASPRLPLPERRNSLPSITSLGATD